MANKIQLKRSSTANSVPLAANLDYGELAINYTDGNLFFLNASNVVTLIASTKTISLSGNITGGNILTSGVVSATGSVTGSSLVGNVFANAQVVINATGQTEGGQLIFAWANIGGFTGQANSTWNIDVDASNILRVFYQNAVGTTNVLMNASPTSNVVTFPSSAGISAVGNVTGNFFIGNGSQLTGITVSAGSTITSGTSNLVVQTNSNIVANVAGAWSAQFTTAGLQANTVWANNNGAGTNFRVGDDIWIGDINLADTMSLRGQQNAANAYIVFGNADGTQLGRAGTGPLTYGGAFSASGNITGGNLIAVTAVKTPNISIDSNSLDANVDLEITTTAGNTISIYNGNLQEVEINTANIRLITKSGVNTYNYVFDSSGNLTLPTAYLVTPGIITSSNTTISTSTTTGAVTIGGGVGVAGNVYAGGIYTAGLVSVTGNITGGNLNTGGLVSATGNLVGGNVTTAGVVTSTGNITGGNILTAGLISATGNITGGNVLGGANVNATTHTGTTVSVTANIDGGNLRTAGLISATGNITSADFAQVANLIITGARSANINVAGVALRTVSSIYTDNTTAASGTATDNHINVLSTPTLAATNLSVTTTRAATLYISGAPINGTNMTITNAYALYAAAGDVVAVANITGGNILTGGQVSATGNISGGNLNVTSITGTNISVSGNVTGGNLLTSGLISATGNITGGNILGGANVNATTHTGTTVSVTANINGGNVISAALVQGVTLSASGNVIGGNVTTAGLISATGNVNGGNLISASLVQGVTLSASGNVIGGNVTTAGLISATGNITGGNILGGANVNATTHTGTTVSVTANITGGNILTGGIVSATGNVTGGNLTTAGQISATGNITGGNILGGANVNATSLTGTTVSVTANITGGNILTGGIVSATGNVTGGNVTTAGLISATGNITGGNLLTSGILSAAGTSTSTMSGNLSMSSKWINNVSDPVAAQDVATKNYVDGVAQGLHIHDSCYVATTTTLAVASGGTTAYDNGTLGVGAKITTTGTYTTIDTGNVQTVGTRILVKNEANAVWNGIYTYANTTALVRATDFDTSAEAAGGDFTFVTSGNVNADTGWVQTTDNPTLGTSNIVWTQFAGAGTYTAGTGLTLTGTTFSVNASQTQVTAVGTLTSLSVSGNTTSGNLITGGLITATGNITGGNVSGTLLTGTLSTAAQPNIISVGTTLGSLTIGNTANGGAVFGNTILTINSGATQAEGAQIVLAWKGISGYTTAGNGTWNLDVDSANTFRVYSIDGVGGANVALSVYANADVSFGAKINATGNITGGNLLTAGLMSATGNVNGGNLISTALVQGVTLSASGNVIGGNVTTAGLITSTGNITGGNIITAGQVSATGNVTGNYFIGNGSQLTGISVSTNSIFNGNSNVKIASANADITMDVNSQSNVVIVSSVAFQAAMLGTYKVITQTGTVAANVNGLWIGTTSITGNVVIPSSSTVYVWTPT